MTLYVDTRYAGAHGIGRFASEVLPRLTAAWTPVPRLHGNPTTTLDALRPARWRLREDDRLYSPGYAAGPTRATQLLTIHDLIHLEDPEQATPLKRAYYSRVVRPAVRRTRVVMTVSETSRRAIESWVDDAHVEVVDVGNGCSPAFRPDPASTRDPDTFVYVGNTKPHKNLITALAALAVDRDARLVAVTPHATAVRQLAAGLGVEPRVEVVTGVDDETLAGIYRAAAALVMPSTLEGFGLPALEAVSCGTPIAYWAGCPSIAEIVGDAGVPVGSPTDPHEWAAGMRGAAELGTVTPAASWRERYDWDHVARRVDTVLERSAQASAVSR
ncbi:glycosyltransferase family 4 protein [Demequina iriomotensis]|uniref:glycosyltransferase family 4 protein n=1 Tax=Demequina iriomotensis TaxID=1536641 RepID=UPI0007856102|nr:glycosyltransferase family 1 protein [Demequina iriomotensis]